MNPPQQMCSALDMFCFAALSDTIEVTMYKDSQENPSTMLQK